ncbi:sensor histidine kinase [Methylocaldum szegediense]|uniref:histidine kinase n=1 Tax=Methylocaldum szegediense TaxID=73780 RepID=A0ABM9I7Y1_9GAMM|nr:ATP-binding protein [Methylocaldum szegediense]CAI8949338.1 Histidine kinase [Methylocaldum szegediense]
MKPFSYRYAQVRGWALLGLLLLVIFLLGGMIWRNLERFETMRTYVGYAHHIQEVAFKLQDALTGYFTIGTSRRLDGQQLSELSVRLAELARHDYHVAPATPSKLTEVSSLVDEISREHLSPDSQEALLFRALKITSAMLDEETLERGRLAEEIALATRTEIALVFGILAAILLLGGLFFRRQILTPLNNLKELLLRLAQEDFTPIETARVDPILLPVFNSYNHMVKRLAELESAKRHHAESLEAEVRAATRALLEQQASLSRAERLAAVGELAAGIAHELRNPLAGIQMTCANLRDEIDDAEQAGRVELIIAELKRMGRLLNELLDHGRHTPAPVSECDVTALIRELVTLVRYQIPPTIKLDWAASGDLVTRLPGCRLRQTLLNLILNSAEAIGDREGSIEIRASRQEDHVLVSVIDDGPGFSVEILENGIRPFATGRPGGTGLGLAMVQRFTRDLGGQLSLSNVEPHGARVSLTLPCQ